MRINFKDSELTYSATSRCPCGAGLAYPTDPTIKQLKSWGLASSDFSYWDCSDILTGRAMPKNQPGHKLHTGELSFIFYEIKSENQPSAGGGTTRPKE